MFCSDPSDKRSYIINLKTFRNLNGNVVKLYVKGISYIKILVFLIRIFAF